MSLVIDHISMSYGKTAVLHDISAEIGKGEFLSILGHSGCGKTTLLKIIGGFMKPTGAASSWTARSIPTRPGRFRRKSGTWAWSSSPSRCGPI